MIANIRPWNIRMDAYSGITTSRDVERAMQAEIDDLRAALEAKKAPAPIAPASQAVSGEVIRVKPFAYCKIDGSDHEYNTINEFSGGRSNGIELFTAKQVQAILDDRLATNFAQASADAKDAARYRWLVSQIPCSIADDLKCGLHEIGDEIDDAIAAMQPTAAAPATKDAP